MSSGLIPPSRAQLTYWLISEREDSITPLGRDSVPEVYMRRSGSSSAIGTSGIVSSPDRHQASTSSQPAAGAVPEAPIQPRTPPWIPAAASACSTPSRVVAKASSTYGQQLWLSSASRSPLARPRSASACAVRLTAASNSA